MFPYQCQEVSLEKYYFSAARRQNESTGPGIPRSGSDIPRLRKNERKRMIFQTKSRFRLDISDGRGILIFCLLYLNINLI